MSHTPPTRALLQEGSAFFRMPREIREHIYDYYMAHMDLFRQEDYVWSHPICPFFQDNSLQKHQPPLSLTCKRMYLELASRVQEQALIRVSPPWLDERATKAHRVAFAFHGKLNFTRLRRLRLVIATKIPKFLEEHSDRNPWLDFFAEVSRRCPNLESLAVHCSISWKPILYDFRKVSFGRGSESCLKQSHEELVDGLAGLRLRSMEVNGLPAACVERLQGENCPRVTCNPNRRWEGGDP